jgi:predicted regulator of Ras-like GTPase activity (Roadblock/LC7/MglB family)
MLMPLNIPDVLAQFATNCPELKGAVVATQDGLVLAATASFNGDIPAACAASLSVHVDGDLSYVHDTGFTESMFWTPPGIWYLARLEHKHLLLAYSQSAEHAGALRLAGQIAAQQINPMLIPLATGA